MVWAIDALQSGRSKTAKQYLSGFPDHLIGKSFLENEAYVHSWELETLINILLSAGKWSSFDVSYSKFGAVADVVNLLRALEDSEHADRSVGPNVFRMLHRIAQRQFHWQREHFNVSQLYRYTYIYGQGLYASEFKERHGVEISDFILYGLSAYAAARLHFRVDVDQSIPELGIELDTFRRIAQLMSAEVPKLRKDVAELVSIHIGARDNIPVALLPSAVRKFPLISFDAGKAFCCPLPELVVMRITSGLYFDVPGNSASAVAARNDANSRFEAYSCELLGRFLSSFQVTREYRYGTLARSYDSPDVLVKSGEEIVISLECKAARLTYAAQFSDDPYIEAKAQYAQLAKGIFQLWRFFSHVRVGSAGSMLAHENFGIVLTLDAFMPMDRDVWEFVLADASRLADLEGGVDAVDRKAIVFCPISDFENVVSRCDEFHADCCSSRGI